MEQFLKSLLLLTHEAGQVGTDGQEVVNTMTRMVRRMLVAATKPCAKGIYGDLPGLQRGVARELSRVNKLLAPDTS